ncbi:hypothetical protein IV500_04675 [Paeniglutamicibacter antarcticus]|uniref:Uncharacterized protein n=1 Tax=Arthrobacter terrae TaxID=2935737 RepID=A0A931CHJ9_9MICC|nr:hypothetical protein [Arthrobacter terrae]MBG0738712.1 hypothetical protein [Arthrobacter terrae]
MKIIDDLAESRRFRRDVVATWGRPNQPAPERLYGKGAFVQHYALDRLSPKALCGGSVMLVSDQPFITRTRLQCPLCVSVVARIMVRAVAEQAAALTKK